MLRSVVKRVRDVHVIDFPFAFARAFLEKKKKNTIPSAYKEQTRCVRTHIEREIEESRVKNQLRERKEWLLCEESFEIQALSMFTRKRILKTQHTTRLSAEEIKCSYLLILLSAIDTPDRRRRRGTCTPNLRVLVAVSSLLRLGQLPSREFEEYSRVIFVVVFVSS